MNPTECFILFVMVVIMVMYIQNFYGEVDVISSTVDKRNYVVQKLPDKQEAANILAAVNKDILKLIWHLRAKYPDNADVKKLYTDYNPNALSEGSITSGYTSYSVNKGEKVILCIRQSDKSFVDKNIILYVAIHELAHIYTHQEVGHTDLFWKNFKFLIEEAVSIGIYKKEDYSKYPKDYCGIKITSSVI